MPRGWTCGGLLAEIPKVCALSAARSVSCYCLFCPGNCDFSHHQCFPENNLCILFTNVHIVLMYTYVTIALQIENLTIYIYTYYDIYIYYNILWYIIIYIIIISIYVYYYYQYYHYYYYLFVILLLIIIIIIIYYILLCIYIYIYMISVSIIRRPRPLPRQGRRLGPPEVWNLALGSQAKAHAIKATPLSATCPRHLPCSCRTLTPTCPRTFKTAVCPASNPPNASAGLQGNNSYSYYMPLPSVFQGVQDCRLPALKPPKRFQRSRRPPRQQLLQLHAPAICFSGGSRLPFARPQTPQTLPTLPQASKATTLTATLCQLHAPDIYHAPAELLHLHAPGRSRLPFARPQTLQTLPQASKATTLTCPRTFKTAVCPASNPPNASAGLQGNNSYSYYMPLPSVFQGVQDCRLPALKPPKRFQRSRRPPRQQLLQLHAPAICFSGGSRLPFARPQTPQTLPTLPQASKATTLTATLCQLHAPDIYHAPAELLHLHAPGRSRLPFARPQTLQTLPQASKATTLTATTCPCHLFFRGFKTAVCPPSNPPNASNAPAGLQGNNSYSYMPLPSVFQGVQDCRLPALKPPKRFQRSRLQGLQGNNSYSFQRSRRPPRQQLLQLHPQGVQDCRLPALKPPKRFQRSRRPPRQQLLQLPSALQTSTMLLPNSYTYMPQDVQDCRLPGLKPSKRFRRPPRQQLLHAPGRSRLPFARPQTLQTLPQASKATTLTATTCPCHLFFRGFKTAVCPPSNPPNASNAPAGLQGNNSYSYMPLPSVFQGVQDCRLPALKPPKRFQRSRRPPRQQLLQLPSVSYMPQTSTMLLPNSYTYMPQDVQDCRLPGLKPSKRFRRPPRQQLLQLLHAPAICFSGGSRLPFARPQTPQTLPTLPQASKATTLTATCPCHLFFRGFKTAVCPPSNPPNASNAPAGLQGNNSYSYMSPNPPNASNPLAGLPGPAICSSGVQDCRLPALKPPKRFQRSRRPPRQQLLQLHAPAICFSGGSRLPFARPQTPQTLPTLPQASKATTLTATCPCHLFFRGFKTAVCPPSNPPNASNAPAGLQGNNSYSYSYMPQTSTMLLPNSYTYMPQDVQDCRLPGLKPSKRFRRPPRQQLLQLLHAPAICFSGGSRLPFARPQTPQTLPTLPQASKATTLTATCPCHLFFRGFKTAVCPPSNPPNASTLPQASKATTLTATCPQTLQTLPTLSQASQALPSVFQGFKTAVCPPSNPPNASNAPAGLQGNNSYSYMSSNPPNASNPLAGLQGNNSYSYMPLPSVFQGVQDCRLPALKPSKRFQRSRRPPRQQLLQLHVQRSRRPPRQQLLQLHAPAICFSGGSRLPFARPQTPQTLPTLPQASKATTLTATCPCHLFFRGSRLPFARPQTPQTLPTLPQASKATTLTATCPCHLFFRGFKTAVASTATCPCHLFFRGFKTAVCPPSNPPNASNAPAGLQGNNSYSYMSLPSVFQGFKTAVASKGTRNVCPASNPPNASARLQGNNSYSYMPMPSVFQGVQDCRLPALKPPKRFQRSRRPPRQQLLQLHAPAICFSRGSRLPFARPQTSQTLLTLPQASKATTLTATLCQLHAPDIYHAPAELLHLHAPGRSRLPFARPQTLQTLPQASKATTLTCPRTFKTAVCPASNPPNASAGLQGNNSYSYYMPLPSVFQGVQDCRLPALKPPKLFQRSRRPPRQQLLQLHAPAICFSGGSRLPFARPQTPQTLPTLPQASKATTLTATCPQTLQTLPTLSQASQALPSVFQGFKTAVCPPSTPQTLPTLPQASKATTLTATTCPCHLFFRGFKTAVCPPSNPPNASNAPAGLQGNNSYSYMPLPSVFQGVQDCRLPALKPPKRFQRSRRPPRQQLLQLPSVSYMPQTSTMLLPNSYTYMPQDVQDCRLPGLKPSKRFRRPPRQQLLQLLHAPAICFSGGSRLPFARPQTPQTLPTLPQASKATTLTATCPCHLFFRGFKTAVCPPSNPPNASNAPAGLHGNNSYSYMSPNPPNASNPLAGLPGPAICFSGVQDCRLPALKPPKRFQRSRRPPRQQLLQLHVLKPGPDRCLFSSGKALRLLRPNCCVGSACEPCITVSRMCVWSKWRKCCRLWAIKTVPRNLWHK